MFDRPPKNTQPIYSYEEKWIWDNPNAPINVFECPAKIPSSLYNQIKLTSIDTFNALKCKDWARIDIRLDSLGIPNIIEVKPIPGIIPTPNEHSCFPLAERQANITFDHLIGLIIDEALARYSIK